MEKYVAENDVLCSHDAWKSRGGRTFGIIQCSSTSNFSKSYKPIQKTDLVNSNKSLKDDT